MRLHLTIVLVVLTMGLLTVALMSRDLLSNSENCHCRLSVLSPKLKSKVAGNAVDYKEVVQVEVSGTGLDSDLLSSFGAYNVRKINRNSRFLVRASLNTILNLSSMPKVQYIQERDGN